MPNYILNLISKDKNTDTADFLLIYHFVSHQYDHDSNSSNLKFNWLQNYLTNIAISISIMSYDYFSNIANHIFTLTEHNDEHIDFKT